MRRTPSAARARDLRLSTRRGAEGSLRDEHNSLRLSVRVGIHTGSVVVDHGNGKEADVFGDAPNVASRVQALAAPDSVLITAAVHDLISGLFVVEDRARSS